MSYFRYIRLADLGHAVTIARGFPTHRAVPAGDIRVMSIADLRNQSPPRYFADRADMEDLGIDIGQPGDVLFSIEGGTVGETLMVQEDIADFVPSQQVATLRVIDSALLDPWYLGAWLATGPAREQLERLARGMGIQRIPIKELSALTIKVPSIELQREIGDRFRAFERAIQSHRSVIACLEELRNTDLIVTFADSSSDAVSEPSSTTERRSLHGH